MKNAALNFISKFPIGSIVTVSDFDDWAIGLGILKDPETDNTKSPEWALLIKERNLFRPRLNDKLMNAEIPSGQRCNIEVHQHGISYIVKGANTALIDATESLSDKIQNFSTGQGKKIDKYLKSVDQDTLTDYSRLRIKMSKNENVRFFRSIERLVDDRSEALQDVYDSIDESMMIEQNKIKALEAD